MSYRKRKSAIITKARKRLSGLEAIDPALDLGNGLTVDTFKTEIDGGEKKLDTYNTKLSDSDIAGNIVDSAEEKIKDLSTRMLEAVGSKYGHDSNEYEMAGGKRSSERKKTVRKPKPPKP